jgi:hypothetical protein
MAVVQDAWARIRYEQTQHLSSSSSDEDLAKLSRATQMQLRGIVQDCIDSVCQLRLSMNEDLAALRTSVETLQEQLEATKSCLASQHHERARETVTPQILAAAVAAIERLVHEFVP